MQNSIIRSKALILGNQLTKHNSNLSKSAAMRFAWNVAKNNPDLVLVQAYTKSGKLQKRVCFVDWSSYNTPKGTGRKTPDHLQLFVDAAKHYAMKSNSTICFIKDNIELIAA